MPLEIDAAHDEQLRVSQLERHASMLFLAASLFMAIFCGAIIVSGWFAGVLIDQWERVFWAGAILGGLMVTTFAVAAAPAGRNAGQAIARITWLSRIGLALFVLAPALCLIGLIGNFYRL